jgi:hypothetical protein
MANPESKMTVTFTKKYIKIKSLEAEVAENLARIESIKARGGNEYLFDECANRLSFLAAELFRMADADEDGNIPTVKGEENAGREQANDPTT